MEKILDVIKFAQESYLSKEGQLKVVYDAYSKWLRRIDFVPSALVKSEEAREAAQQSVHPTNDGLIHADSESTPAVISG